MYLYWDNITYLYWDNKDAATDKECCISRTYIRTIKTATDKVMHIMLYWDNKDVDNKDAADILGSAAYHVLILGHKECCISRTYIGKGCCISRTYIGTIKMLHIRYWDNKVSTYLYWDNKDAATDKECCISRTYIGTIKMLLQIRSVHITYLYWDNKDVHVLILGQ
ncbi:unnamed protein product [Mytilus edulis]|uniref:Uncharacterized protein n=1 Tax=Mytilus edulis TaxID=6550 RepID=A0A8S3VEA0_MYTED|nr:unnamed protein product [Mytilus edulis]